MPDTIIKTVYKRYNSTENRWEVILFKTSADQILETENKKVMTAVERNKLAELHNVTDSDVAAWGYAKTADIEEGYQPLDADLSAIANLTGTSGLLKKTAANTWSLDTTSYVSQNRKINTKALSSDITLYGSDITLASDNSNTVTDAINNIRTVAEGKTKAYVIGALSSSSNTYINSHKTDNTIYLKYAGSVNMSSITLINNTSLDITSLRTGDVLYFTDTDIPDRWVSVTNQGNDIALFKLETTKVDLTDYVLKTTTVNGHALSGNVIVTKGDVGLGNVENTALSTWAGSTNLTTVKKGTLGDACVKGVVTTMTGNTTSVNLITAKAVYDYVSRAVAETHKITLGTTQPSSPNAGDIWLDTNNAITVS